MLLTVRELTIRTRRKPKQAWISMQGLHGGAPVDEALHRALGDRDVFKPEVLEQGEEKRPRDGVIREAAASDGESAEAAREPEHRRRRLLEQGVVELLEVVQSGGPEPRVHGSS